MNINPNTLLRITRRIKKLKTPPVGRIRKELAAEFRGGLQPEILAEAAIKALDGSVEDAALLAEAFRPGWRVTLTPDGEGINASITAPPPDGTDDSAAKPLTFTATRDAAYPALALLVATLLSATDASAPELKQTLGWRDHLGTAIGLVLLAAMLFFGAAFLQAMWEGFWEGWSY